jgi:hypothetical protein
VPKGFEQGPLWWWNCGDRLEGLAGSLETVTAANMNLFTSPVFRSVTVECSAVRWRTCSGVGACPRNSSDSAYRRRDADATRIWRGDPLGGGRLVEHLLPMRMIGRPHLNPACGPLARIS